MEKVKKILTVTGLPLIFIAGLANIVVTIMGSGDISLPLYVINLFLSLPLLGGPIAVLILLMERKTDETKIFFVNCLTIGAFNLVEAIYSFVSGGSYGNASGAFFLMGTMFAIFALLVKKRSFITKKIFYFLAFPVVLVMLGFSFTKVNLLPATLSSFLGFLLILVVGLLASFESDGDVISIDVNDTPSFSREEKLGGIEVRKKLHELEKAKEEGLITDKEYKRKRKKYVDML